MDRAAATARRKQEINTRRAAAAANRAAESAQRQQERNAQSAERTAKRRAIRDAYDIIIPRKARALSYGYVKSEIQASQNPKMYRDEVIEHIFRTRYAEVYSSANLQLGVKFFNPERLDEDLEREKEYLDPKFNVEEEDYIKGLKSLRDEQVARLNSSNRSRNAAVIPLPPSEPAGILTPSAENNAIMRRRFQAEEEERQLAEGNARRKNAQRAAEEANLQSLTGNPNFIVDPNAFERLYVEPRASKREENANAYDLISNAPRPRGKYKKYSRNNNNNNSRKNVPLALRGGKSRRRKLRR